MQGVTGPARLAPPVRRTPDHLPVAVQELTTTRRSGRAATGLGTAVLLGALAGAAAKAADESGLDWAADLGSDPAVWVLVVALIGRVAATPVAAALRAATSFAAMTVAYYSWAAAVLGFGWDARLVLAWLLLSATAVPAVAAGVQWATRRPGVLPGALLALAAGVTLTGGAVRQLWWTWTGVLPDALGRPVQAGVDLAVVLVLTLLLPRHRRTRLWAPALVLPMVWLAEQLLDLLRRLLSLG